MFVPTLPPEALRPLAAAADRHLDELWLWEDCFKESSIAAAGATLGWTEHVRVGIGLTPVPLRNVALHGDGARDTAPALPRPPAARHRARGAGLDGARSARGPASPLTLLREYAEALRRLLDGHEVTVSGRYVALDRVRLDWPPEPGTPLLVGGTGPRTLELAGRLGDGILIGSVTSEAELADSVAAARAGWVAARGDEPRMPVVTHLLAATGPGAEQRLDDELRRWDRSDGARGRGVAGDATTVADAVRRLSELGATSVVLQPTEDEPDLAGFVEFVGREVRAALEA